MTACLRDTPLSMPPRVVRSTSGKTSLTGSSRPITTSSLLDTSKLSPLLDVRIS